MSEEAAVFQKIVADKERSRVLDDLKFKSLILAGLTEDQHQFLLTVRGVEENSVQVEVMAPAGRALKFGDVIQITFGLPDGQYLIRTKIENGIQGALSFKVGEEMYRLQRRKNFRTKVPPKQIVTLALTSYRTKPVGSGATLGAIDISVGGARMVWPATGPKAEENAAFAGMMTLPSGKQLELFGIVKNIYPAPKGDLQVGVEFQNVSLRDEQALLFACLQFQREQMKSR